MLIFKTAVSNYSIFSNVCLLELIDQFMLGLEKISQVRTWY